MLDQAAASARLAVEMMKRQNEPSEAIARFIASAAAALKDNGAEAAVWRPLVHQGIAFMGDQRDLTWARLTLLLERFAPITTRPILAARWEGIDEEALRIARTDGDEEDYARTLQPFQIRSRAETDSLRERVRTWRQPAAINRALMMIGADLIYTHGAFRDAVPFFEEMIATARETGSIVTQGEAWIRLALAHYSLGNFQEAAHAEQEGRNLVQRLPVTHRLQASYWWVRAMRADLLDGDWEPIASYWSSFISDPANAESAVVLDDAALAALAHVRMGNIEEGRRLLHALTEALRKLDASVWLLNGAVAVGGAVVWELGERADAPVYAGLAEALIRRGIGDYPCCSNRLTIARMAALQGDQQQAARAFALARDELACAGQRPLRAIAEIDQARSGLLHGAVIDRSATGELIDRAETAFRDLGMSRHLEDVARVRATLEQSGQRPRRATLPAGLTERELDILRLVARGYSDRRISEELFVSPRTVHTHLRNMLTKTELSNRTELSVWAVEQGLVAT
jgi:DNA-binding CsgD family transcriptional regulator